MTDTPKTTTPGGNTLTDWSYAGIVEDEGATLYGITHDGHTFAEKIGLIKSYARLSNDAGSTFVPFSLGVEAKDVGKELTIVKQQKRSPDFYYQLSHKLYNTFTIGDLVGSGQRLVVTQIFGFTETSGSPRHETVGIASAGRFYPTLDFRVPKVTDPDAEAIDTLRFDYWIEPDIAAGGKRRINFMHPGVEFPMQVIDIFFAEDLAKPVPQQAGLFRDRDHSVFTRPVRVGGVFEPKGGQVFEGAEKPLLWEVAADGIRHGGKSGWDNIHCWGYSSTGLVSTPGMPYGMHLHWRWAAALTNPLAMTFGDFTPDFLRAPELAGRDSDGDMVPGGPLIDPRNPDTDLRIAFVTKSVAEQYARMTASDPEDFTEIFEKIAADPDGIENGQEGMVIIISIVVRRPKREETWRGTVFPHGFFFPHAYELGYFAEAMLTAAGAYAPQYIMKPPPAKKWSRDPIT